MEDSISLLDYKNKYKIGIIGFGGFGNFLYSAWSALDRVEVVSIADIRTPILPRSNLRIYDNWKHLISDEKLDIVAIATPPSSHAEIACAAMEAGKHVIIEKPIALSVYDARKIIAMRDKTNMRATVDYMLRFNPIVDVFTVWNKSLPFGPLRRVIVENYAQDESLDADHWFWDKRISGGIFVEHGTHFFDLINHISGSEPQQVTGTETNRNSKLTDRVLANVKYKNGLLATFYHSFTRPGIFEDTSIRLIYDLAQIEIGGWIPLLGKVKALVNDNSMEELSRLPNISIIKRQTISEIKDESRPKGWGTDEMRKPGISGKIKSSGIEYVVIEMVNATFKLAENKTEVYSGSLKKLLLDFIQSIGDPKHRQAITLEDSIISLDTAILSSSM